MMGIRPEVLEKLKVARNYAGSTALGGGLGSLLGFIEGAKANIGVKDKKKRRSNLKAGAIAGGITGGLGGAFLYNRVRKIDKLRAANRAKWDAERQARQAKWKAEEEANNAEWAKWKADSDEWWKNFNQNSRSSRSSGSGGSRSSGYRGYASGFGNAGFDTGKKVFKDLGGDIDGIKTKSELKKLYRSLAMKYHPDRNKAPNADEMFKKLNNAHEALQKTQWYEKLAFLINSLGGMEKLANKIYRR